MSDRCSPDAAWPALADHRLLSDGRSAALLTPAAEVDWWCTPRFDAAPTCWSILDRAGGAASFAGAEPVAADGPAAGPVLETTLVAGGRRFVARDGLLDGALVRVVRPLAGPLDVRHHAALGGFEGEPSPRCTVTHLVAAEGEAAAVRVTTAGVEVVDAAEASRWLDAVADRRASPTIVHGRLHRQRVVEAFDVLEACTYEPTGAIVAAPTTSLPEAIGADRQFDYRFAWLRDGSLVASVSALAGRLDVARRHLDFVCALGDRVLSSPLFSVDGDGVPAEREVPAARGHRGSGPVRVGNAATEQVQFDALGFVVEAVSTYTREGGRLPRPLWRLVVRLADRCADPEPRDTGGIWELRDAQPLVSADIGRWIALDRAVRVAWRRRPWHVARRRRWRRAADEARTRVLGAIAGDGRVPQRYGGDPDDLDASTLLAVMFGLVDAGDPRRERVVDRHLEGLGEGPLLRRYRPGEHDGFHGIEGCFVPCSWWAVTALVAVGRVDEASARADALCRLLPALLPEELDPVTGDALGNLPLAWSHAELVRSMQVLERALVRQRWGRSGALVRNLARRARRRLRLRTPSGT